MNTARFSLIITIAILFSIGIIMVYNTTSAEVLEKSLTTSTHLALIKQIIYGAIGIIIGIFVFIIGYHNILRISPLLFFLTTVLLALVFVPNIGLEINGAKRWLGFGPISFQPSEIMKYLLPIFFINHIANGRKFETFWGFVKYLSIFIIPIALILLEPDNGTTAIILMTFLIMFFLFKIKLRYWAFPLFLFVIIGTAIAANMPHIPGRIQIYLHPELDIRGKGHQPYQAKIAAGSGQLMGKGLGQSMQKLNYLPEARSDYIAAIYAEEFGFVGMLFLISLYLVITFSGFFIAVHSRDRQGFYLAAILTFLISFQAFINLGVVSGLLPSKGIALPFFSQGGSSLIVNLVAFFLVLNVAYTQKNKEIQKKLKKV